MLRMNDPMIDSLASRQALDRESELPTFDDLGQKPESVSSSSHWMIRTGSSILGRLTSFGKP